VALTWVNGRSSAHSVSGTGCARLTHIRHPVLPHFPVVHVNWWSWSLRTICVRRVSCKKFLSCAESRETCESQTLQ
jgi:hypothetical protein